MSKKDKDVKADPAAITFVASDDASGVLTIVFQRQMKGVDPVVRDLALVRMQCGHFCSYPTAGNGQCCQCGKTLACVVSMQGFQNS